MNAAAAEEALRLCLAGRISPEVALARMVLAGLPPEAIEERLSALPAGNGREGALAGLHRTSRGGLEAVRAMLAEARLDHTAAADHESPEALVARVAAAYDRAVAVAPEASVAAYSLNDPAVLAAATREIVAWLADEALIRPDRDVLDLGCGIGRVAAALAPRCRSVLGLDASPRMVAEALRRHGSVPNLRFGTTPGTDLAALAAASFDLVLAVDSFPYVVQAGGAVADRHLEDAARAVRRGGAFAILNLSYRGDLEADRADAKRWAVAGGWTLAVDGARPFALWDGTAFLLRRP
ncbi:class I SAM-dependent methyltransferase [Craurococcus roseus]|uniref:Class I SAM-dependent methyltransferase n=1 Tax=Craurococcus roseus TaxID=77585 RepID=A0ABP3QUM3_9PROT